MCFQYVFIYLFLYNGTQGKINFKIGYCVFFAPGVQLTQRKTKKGIDQDMQQPVDTLGAIESEGSQQDPEDLRAQARK